MTGPIDIMHAALAGGAAGVVTMALAIVVMSVWDLHRRVKDGVPLHRHAWAVVANTPKHTYYGTDWEQAGKVTAYMSLATTVLGAVVLIFAVGIREVFL